MKKYLLSFMIGLMSIPVLLTGCTQTPLANSPTETANMKINGSALVYNDYIYFANAFQSASSMESGYNAQNTSLKRIGLTNNKITMDEDTSLPTGQDTVIQKVIGSDYTFMYSSGKYIYFASPSQEINPSTHGEHYYTYNEYFRVNTDGTGLTKFYASNNSITQQTVLTIDQKEYLILVNGTELVKIELGDKISKPIVLAKDFTSAIFATEYSTSGDQNAYYITDLPDEPEYINETGNLLYGVDIVTGESLRKDPETGKPLAFNQTQIRTISLKEVENGSLFFTIQEQVGSASLSEVYAKLTGAFTYKVIQQGLTAISAFDVMVAENNEEYYVFSDTSGTFALPSTTTDIQNYKLLDQETKILFTSGDYIYFVYTDTENNPVGFNRISVLNQDVEQINSVSDYKTTNISFDGKHIYFYALNTDNTSGTYYMHRSRVDTNQANIELLSTLLNDDQPETEEE